MLSDQYLTKVHRRISGRNLLLRYVALTSIALGLCLGITDGHAREPDELQQLRALVQQQQRQIEALMQKVEGLEQAGEATKRLAEGAREEVDAVREDVAQAQDDAGEAREIAETTRTLTIERESLADSTRTALGAPPVGPAVKEQLATADVVTSPEGFTVSVGGHVNREINVADDGDDTKAYFVDSGTIPSYLYVKASGQITDDLTLGGHVEAGIQDNSATRVSQDNETTGTDVVGRYFELTLDSKTYGRLAFGKGFSSSFWLAEVDKSGTYSSNLLSVGNKAGGLKFYDKDTDSLSGIRVLDAFIDIEAINLVNRVSYDSPVWKGFRLAADAGENQFSAAALKWNHGIGDFDLSYAGSGANNPQGGRIDWRVDSGLGVLHKPTGLNLTVAGQRNGFAKRSENGDGYIARAGLRRNWFSFGETKMAIDYARGWDVTQDGDRAKSAGAFVFQEVRDWNTELFAGYRLYDLNREDRRLDDIHVYNLGARFWFDSTAKVPKPGG